MKRQTLAAIQRKAFEFKVRGPKLRGTLSIAIAFHPNSYEIALKKATRRAVHLSGDEKARFVTAAAAA